MGILNVTPDSFSDGGRYHHLKAAIVQAEHLVESGADIIDVGGESTRPNAQVVDLETELARVIPLIQAIRSLGKPISIDTSKPEVMRAAVEAGASMINDVNALQADNAIEAAKACHVPICLMHRQGSPKSMQLQPSYDNVVDDVLSFLDDRVSVCQQAGIAPSFLCIDPGFGFGKLLEHNIALLKSLERFQKLQYPVLVGLSRKSMLGQLTGQEVDDRLAASLAATLIAAIKSANIVRVHDVEETRDVLTMYSTIYSH